MSTKFIPQAPVAQDIALRDLTNEQFEERYGCDRFASSVLTSRFRYVVDDMASQVSARAFSPILRDVSDLSASLCGTRENGYVMPAVAPTLPVFFGSIPHAVRISIEEYGPDRLGPGDTLISNDPYRVGTHLNDVCFIRPVFAADTMIAVLSIRAHMLDWGGKAKGGFAPDKTTLFEDGLVFSPQLIYKSGEKVEGPFMMIRDNTRFPEWIIPDIDTIKACLDAGEARLVETYEKYGHEAFLGSMRYACDVSAETAEEAISKFEDGTFEGQERLDANGMPGDDGGCLINVRVTKKGSRIEFDLSGTDAANHSSFNCTWPEAASSVVTAFKWLVDRRSPYTSGVSRHIDVVAPRGSAVNPDPPHSSNLYHQVVHAIVTATTRALNAAMGPDAVGLDAGDMAHEHVAGVREGDGESWFTPGGTIVYGTPWGGTRDGDGESSVSQPYNNIVWNGDEVVESYNPMAILRREYVTDSGGPGKHRGGAATSVDVAWFEPGDHYVWGLMVQREGDYGAYGGRSGSRTAAWFWEPGASILDGAGLDFLPEKLSDAAFADATPVFGLLDPKTLVPSNEGKLYVTLDPVPVRSNSMERLVSNGGGGWGDPFERDVTAVLRDVRDEYVSIAGAARDYGVVIVGDPQRDPEGLRVDETATAQLRATRSEEA